jgi:hypothetical protein
MRKLILAATTIAALAAPAMFAVPAMASGAPIRECGNPGPAGIGATSATIKNLTTRSISCGYGRQLARQWARSGSLPRFIGARERVTVRGCTTITDVRGVGGQYVNGQIVTFVVHFQAYGWACD